MLCSFCGTDNRPEYKFCGMCGVRLERRHAERRVNQGVSTKCSGCGHVNDSGQKFCGMCGSRVERRVQDRRASEGEPRAVAIANAQLPTPDVASKPRPQPVQMASSTPDIPAPLPRKAEPAIFRNEPVKEPYVQDTNISGPSFLGLGSQAEGNGDYLLEDEPSRGGVKKVLFLVIIIVIAGLIFMQWRSSLKANPRNSPPKVDPASTGPATAPQGNNQPPSANSPDQSATNTGSDSVEASTAKDTKDPKNATASPSTANSKNTADNDSKDAQGDSPAAPSESASAASADPPEESAGKTASNKPDNSDSQPSAEPKSAETKTSDDRKPSAALLRAQQYLQGRGGVQQNCEQGLLYLHAATEKNDPGAAIQMAALYSSGHCVKQDRVMAYRWFNSAHELEPANMWIQKNMDQLWAQMTTQERRLAGY